jgi:hypothetical protein
MRWCRRRASRWRSASSGTPSRPDDQLEQRQLLAVLARRRSAASGRRSSRSARREAFALVAAVRLARDDQREHAVAARTCA